MIGRILCTGVLSLVAAGCASVPAREERLLDGAGLAGWELQTTPAARLQDVVTMKPDGVLDVAGKPAGIFATTASFRNYRLHVEWRWTGQPGNAGVLLHVSPGAMDRRWRAGLRPAAHFVPRFPARARSAGARRQCPAACPAAGRSPAP